MSLFLPTTTMTVESPTRTTDEFGDPAEAWAPYAVRQPAAFAERRKHVLDPVTGRTGTITFAEALLPAHLGVSPGDRVYDHSSGRYHHVTHVHRPQNLAFPGTMLRVELEDPDQ